MTKRVNIEGMGAYANDDLGYVTVWSNESKVFVGSTSSGVKYLNKSDITYDIDNPINLTCFMRDYLNYPDISSNNIRYLHGNDELLLCITDSGVDVYKLGMQAYRSTSSESNAYKGFMTSTGKFYYTVSGSNEWSVHRVNTCLFDWSIPDAEYKTGGSILASGIKLNDIFVTENTSSDGISNTLFIATSSGVYMIDEGSNKYNIYYKE